MSSGQQTAGLLWWGNAYWIRGDLLHKFWWRLFSSPIAIRIHHSLNSIHSINCIYVGITVLSWKMHLWRKIVRICVCFVCTNLTAFAHGQTGEKSFFVYSVAPWADRSLRLRFLYTLLCDFEPPSSVVVVGERIPRTVLARQNLILESGEVRYNFFDIEQLIFPDGFFPPPFNFYGKCFMAGKILGSFSHLHEFVISPRIFLPSLSRCNGPWIDALLFSFVLIGLMLLLLLLLLLLHKFWTLRYDIF